ncbi:hypothetical protein GY45DRAFT_1329499 [Cubamyces sp. BRFM 1775]|nr:hypothetical protein GY45DRAFT_1329499 [Cubamyces sp. BRFM 1775]
MHVPINKLPPELLGDILRRTLPPAHGNLTYDDYPEDIHTVATWRRSITTLLQVCGYWRTILLNMASLWSIIDMSSDLPWSLGCLERSGNAPLDVFLQYPLNERQCAPLLSQGHRIRALHLDIPRPYRAEIPTDLPMFLPTVPNLESLLIATRCYLWDGEQPPLDLADCPLVFQNPPPNLKKLVLYSPCWFPGGIQLHQLTHLLISCNMSCDRHSLLALIRQSPLLEQLILAEVFIDGPDEPSSGTAPMIHLPRLRHFTLRVDNTVSTAHCMLEHLQIPSTATVRIVGREAFHVFEVMMPRSFPFTEKFNTLVVEGTHSHVAIEATGPSSGLVISISKNQHSTSIYDQGFARGILAWLIPCKNIKSVTISSVRCDRALELLPESLSPLTLRLMDRGSYSFDPRFEEMKIDSYKALLRGIARFQEVTELHIWSSYLALNPPIRSLERYTFYHVHAQSVRKVALRQYPCHKPTLDTHADFDFVDKASYPVLGLGPPKDSGWYGWW